MTAGTSTGVTLAEQIYVERGEILCRVGEALPQVSSLLRVELFWMGRRPMVMDRPYKMKLATAQCGVRLKKIERVMDASDLKSSVKKEIDRHDVARCVLETMTPVAFDRIHELAATGRFVIVDEYDIAGGGIVREAIDDPQSSLRRQVARRQEQWDFSIVDPEERAARYGHRPALVLLTGKVGLDKRTIAKELERQLFARGAKTYLLGMGNLLRGLNADVEQHRLERHEHVRRMGEVAHLFLDAGLIVVATASNLSETELKEIHEATSQEKVLIVHVGSEGFSQEQVDLRLEPQADPRQAAEQVIRLLQARAVLKAG